MFLSLCQQEVKMLIVQLQSCSRIKDQEIYLLIGKKCKIVKNDGKEYPESPLVNTALCSLEFRPGTADLCGCTARK